MIENITAKSCFSLLKWLPVVAAALLVAAAPKSALAQSTGPSTAGYVMTGCDSTPTDNGDYYYVGTDSDGNPYYENGASGAYLECCTDDQNNRPYMRWYIYANASAAYHNVADYASDECSEQFVWKANFGPATGWDTLDGTEVYLGWWDDNVYGPTDNPVVTSL